MRPLGLHQVRIVRKRKRLQIILQSFWVFFTPFSWYSLRKLHMSLRQSSAHPRRVGLSLCRAPLPLFQPTQFHCWLPRSIIC